MFKGLQKPLDFMGPGTLYQLDWNLVGHFLVDKVLAFKSRNDGRIILGYVRHQLSLLRGEHGNGQRIHREIGLQYHPEIGIGLNGISDFSSLQRVTANLGVENQTAVCSHRHEDECLRSWQLIPGGRLVDGRADVCRMVRDFRHSDG